MLLNNLYKKLFKRKKLEPIIRNFTPSYFLDSSIQKHYEQYGYAIIPNCIDTDTLQFFNQLYTTICQKYPYNSRGNFYTTGNIDNANLRAEVQEAIKSKTIHILEKIVDANSCNIHTGGSLLIKPPSTFSDLDPHQDIPVIDETQHYASYLWFPLSDITADNGALTVLPGSHLWGNHQRSRIIPSIFGSYTSIIKKDMTPLTIHAGDAICFDSATIHGSLPNNSDITRVAISIAIFPKQHQVYHYAIYDDTPKGMVDKYEVDEDFYIKENVLLKPPDRYKKIAQEKWIGNHYFTKNSIKKLISQFKGS